MFDTDITYSCTLLIINFQDYHRAYGTYATSNSDTAIIKLCESIASIMNDPSVSDNSRLDQ